MRKRCRDGSKEAVRVKVEDCEVGQEAELVWKRARDVGMVEIDSGDGLNVSVVGCWCAIDALVGAHIMAFPIRSEAIGVGSYCFFPCLEGNEGIMESNIAALCLCLSLGLLK